MSVRSSKPCCGICGVRWCCCGTVGTIHTRREVQRYLAAHPRVSPYDFPPYAPELNPAEHIWNRADAALANGAPQDVDQLRSRLHQAIRTLRGSQRRLWSCIEASTLPWDR